MRSIVHIMNRRSLCHECNGYFGICMKEIIVYLK